MRRRAIRNFTSIRLSRTEMEDIFIPERRPVCQTCHKVRIKKKISPDDFEVEHQNLICSCDNHPNIHNNNDDQNINHEQNNNHDNENNNIDNNIPGLNEHDDVQELNDVPDNA